MNEKEFEQYWLANREQILSHNDEYNKAKSAYKMKSGYDWLLFAIPVVTGIVYMDYCPLKSEMLKWIASAIVTILTFVICVFIKSKISGDDSPEQVEQRLKEHTKKGMNIE